MAGRSEICEVGIVLVKSFLDVDWNSYRDSIFERHYELVITEL